MVSALLDPLMVTRESLSPVSLTAAASPSLESVLRERFGLQEFRPWQREAIDAVLGEPGRVLVVAPTGGGKSLVYQLPAAVLEGTTLVLSPLVALMEDQVRSLTARGIEATYLASTLDLEERRLRESELARGRYKLVYAAPERLASDAFVSLLGRCRISLVAVDEAHCISQWGHDFRPDYLRIGGLVARLKPPRILACTATATASVRQEICKELGLSKGPFLEVLRGFARPNLHLAARSVEGPKEARVQVLGTLDATLGSPRAPKGGAIVYAATRRSTEQVAAVLREKGWNAAHYHAGLDAETRTRVSTRFADRRTDIVVATNAFGMGIDRSDIRAVVHVQPPSSIEAYYQEVGRAGRDGDEAHGLLLCSGTDIALRRRLVQMGTDGVDADPVLAARAWDLFRELLRYLDARTCRHDFVLRYFGDEGELLGGCGHCDICEALGDGRDERGTDEGAERATLIVRKVLSAVARAQRRAGLGAVVEMLRGVDSERTRKFGFTSLSTFGLLKEHPPEWLLSLLRATLAAGWIDLTPTEHPVPFLTKAGADVMRGTSPARLMLPPASEARRAKRAAGVAGATAKPRGPRDEAMPFDEALRPAFEKLRAHRAEVARARRVPPYVVAFDRTLIELAALRPRSKGELASVYGMGPARIEQYGEGFLAVLAAESAGAS
jgi:ATP-dependent DNA helicase RecQ